MFEESLVESTAVLGRRSRWPAIVSLGLQAAVGLVMLALPMLRPEMLPLHAPVFSLVPPAPRPPQVPLPQRVHIAASAANAFTAPAENTQPRIERISSGRPMLPSQGDDDIPATTSVIFGSGGTGLPFSTNPLSSGSGSRIVVSSPHDNILAKVSSGVSAGLLLEPIRPEYPQMAKLTHTEGTVIVQAIISKAGKIERAQVVNGPAMLQAAALEAVRNAHYRPYLLNNEPTEVDTTFSIIFRMGG